MSSIPDLEVVLATGPIGRCTSLAALDQQMLASVEFRVPDAPVLTLADPVELEFVARDLELSIHSEALTVERTDRDSVRVYGFRCDISKRAFLHLVGRRRASRVRLSPTLAPRVRVLGMEGSAVLHDVSAAGLSILVDTRQEKQMAAKVRAQVVLELAPLEISLTAAIRHRRWIETGILYGLEIEHESKSQQRFLDYVRSLSGDTEAEAPEEPSDVP